MKVVHIINRLIKLFEELMVRASKYNAMVLFQLVIYSINIVAFLIGVEYFTAKPSIKITNSDKPILFAVYDPKLMRDFFQKNSIQIPQTFYLIEPLRNFILHHDAMEIPLLGQGASDLEFQMFFMKNGGASDEDKMVITKLKSLEDRIDNIDTYIPDQSTPYAFSGSDINPANREYIKKKLSKFEYHLFLSSFIYSRRVSQVISIENNGEVDLQDLMVVIPAPLSKITGSRENNILLFNNPQFSSKIINILESPNKITLNIPSLKSSEQISFRVVTRENKISEKEILYSFREQKHIKSERISRYLIFSLISLSVIRIVFNGKRKP